MRRVVILGGTGVFGSRVAAGLARRADVELVLVGRREAHGRRCAAALGARFVAADVTDTGVLGGLLAGTFVVVHAAGPFQDREHAVARAAVAAGCHYVDLSDGRQHVASIGALHTEACAAGLMVVAGASTVPAVTDLMVARLAGEFAGIDAIEIALSPGNKNPRGVATVGAVLSSAGAPVRVWSDGHWVTQQGWGSARRIEFPEPVGTRDVYLCAVPDLDLLPERYGAASVWFGAGMELSLNNRMLSLLAARRRPDQAVRWARAITRLSRLTRPLGTTAGALVVSASGVDEHERPCRRRVALVAPTDGPAIPAAPAVLITRRLLESGPPFTGAAPALGLLDWAELLAELSPTGMTVAHDQGDGWQSGDRQP